MDNRRWLNTSRSKFWILIAVLLLFGCINQQSNLKQREIIKTRDRNGVLYEQEVIKSAKDSVVYDGFYKEYYPNGVLKVLAYFKNGIQDSITVKYRIDGSIEFRNYYINGQKRGFQDIFYENGKYKNRSYNKNDSNAFFSVDYFDDSIIEVRGKPIRVILDKSPTSIKIGERVFIVNEVVKLDNNSTVLNLKLFYNNNKIIDTLIDKFSFIDNYYYQSEFYTFPRKGIYKYVASSKIVNEDNTVAEDSVITVFEITE